MLLCDHTVVWMCHSVLMSYMSTSLVRECTPSALCGAALPGNPVHCMNVENIVVVPFRVFRLHEIFFVFSSMKK